MIWCISHPLPKRLLITIDLIVTDSLQLSKVQRIRDCRMGSPKRNLYPAAPLLGLRDQSILSWPVLFWLAMSVLPQSFCFSFAIIELAFILFYFRMQMLKSYFRYLFPDKSQTQYTFLSWDRRRIFFCFVWIIIYTNGNG